MAGEIEVELDTSDLREVLGAVKDFSPALARRLRKDLRTTGDGIIAEQKAILAGPLPGAVSVAGRKTRLVTPRDGRRPYLRTVNVYEERDRVARDRKKGMRQKIAAGLKTRVVTGKTRQGVSVRTTRSISGPMANAWQARIFRHPVFSHAGGTFVNQYGKPYFWGPAVAGREEAAKKVEAAIAAALAEID